MPDDPHPAPRAAALESDAPPAAVPPADKPGRAPAGGWTYVGPGVTPGVPLRDLTAGDLADLQREGWDLPAVYATGNWHTSPTARALTEKEEAS